MRSIAPQKVSETVWYYENARSLVFVVEVRTPLGNFERAIQFTVPAHKLRKSLERMAKKITAPKKARRSKQRAHPTEQ